MNQPEIKYAKTEDEVNIAYCIQGAGPPLLQVPLNLGDIAGEQQLDDMVRWHERMSRTHTLIRYDPRGSGSSDRGALNDSLDASVRDLDAVVNALSLGAFDVIAGSWETPAALVYAARRPQHVNRLVLWNGFARAADRKPSVGIVATRALMEKDWRTYTNAWAQTHFGWANAEQGRAWARFYQQSTGPENIIAQIALMDDVDLTDVLPKVRAKTLVVDHRLGRENKGEAARFIAARLPDARLVVLDGPQVPAWAIDASVESNARLIDEFLGVATPEPAVAAPAGSGTAIILFADIANSTALTEELGDAAFREKARALDTALRDAISRAGGTAIEGKLLGDGVLATFGAAREAIACAQACHEVGSHTGLPLHIGIHAGDVIREDGNVFGGAVNVAARISDASEAGETLVSGTVRDLARTSAGVSFEDRGERDLKGVSDAVRVWALGK